MSQRPRVTAGVLAGVAEWLPARLRHRLDTEPDIADHWTWTESGGSVEVRVSSEVRVRIAAGTVSDLSQVGCTCLLAPRCLHLAAVLLRLPLAEESATDAPRAGGVDLVSLSSRQRAAAEQAWSSAAALLDAGASGAGLLLISELLRAVHSCREAGLYRVAAAGQRVAQRLRDLQAERPTFRLGALTADLAVLLSTSRQLALADEARREWVGTARRAYASVGSLRVSGLFSEAVVSAAGYAGVVTYLCDQAGRIWSLADVAPGPAERCLLAYASPIDLGDASLAHRALAREGLYVQRATGSADGRLGAGRGVGAVHADGSAWTDEPLAGLWREPLEDQLDRAWSTRMSSQRAGLDLVFIRGVVRGVAGPTLELVTDGGLRVSGLAASDDPDLGYRSNLRLLGCVPGAGLLAIGRVIFGRPRSVVLLAVAPAEPGTFDLPANLANRVNLGLDVLRPAHLRRAAAQPVVLASETQDPAPIDPLDALRRRVYQVVSGGRSVVSEVAHSGLARDEAALQRANLATAAQVLRGLGSASPVGLSGDARRERLARSWLVAWMYLSAANARIQRLSWTNA